MLHEMLIMLLQVSGGGEVPQIEERVSTGQMHTNQRTSKREHARTHSSCSNGYSTNSVNGNGSSNNNGSGSMAGTQTQTQTNRCMQTRRPARGRAGKCKTTAAAVAVAMTTTSAAAAAATVAAAAATVAAAAATTAAATTRQQQQWYIPVPPPPGCE